MSSLNITEPYEQIKHYKYNNNLYSLNNSNTISYTIHSSAYYNIVVRNFKRLLWLQF